MAPVGDYHGCSRVLDCFHCFWGSLSKPVAKQASKGRLLDTCLMLPTIPASFYCGIYKDYNRRKSVLTLK